MLAAGEKAVARAEAAFVALGREFGRTPNQRVSIGRGELLELEVRKLDRTRTGLIVGATAAVAGSILIKSLRGDPGKEQLPGGGGTDNIVFLRVWWP